MSLKFKVFVFIALSILCINQVNAACVSPCAKCVEGDDTKCATCVDNYFLETDKCTPCSSNCKTCTSATKCSACVSTSFVVKADACVACADAPLAQCQTCDSLTSCLTCKTDAYVIKDKICQTCVAAGLADCLTCSATDTCKTCSAGKYLNGKVCAACPTTLLNCLECSAADTCTKCSAGNYVKDSKCETCPTTLTNCVECSAATTCTKCSAGNYVKDNKCETCPTTLTNCTECSASDTCTKCSKGFYLDATTKKCTACNAGCSECTDAGLTKCTACSAGFFLTGTTCAACTAGCSACSAAADKCTGCSDGFALVGGNSCTACTSPCKTCSTSITTCTSCVAGSGLNGAVCQVNDCKTNTTAPYAWIGKTKECTDCKNNIIINGAICKESTIPTVTVAAADFVYTATVACKTKADAYLLYSLSQTVTLYNGTVATGLDGKTYTKSQVERAQWLQFEKKTTADDGTATVVLSKAKNSGEVHNVVLFCQSSADQSWTRSVGVATFTSKNAEIKGLTIAITGLTATLDGPAKLKAAKLIQTELGVTEVLTDDNQGSLNPLPATGRILADAITAKFYVLPDYSLTAADPKITAGQPKVDAAFVTKIGLTGTPTATITSFVGESVALDNAFPALVLAKDSIKLSLKLVGSGSPKVDIYYKALTAVTNNTNSTNAYEAVFSTISAWSKVNGTVNSTAATEFTIPSLTASTSYQLHYFVENTATPVLRSAVFGQIGTTAAADDTTGLINLKTGLVSLIVLMMAIFA